MKQKEWIHGNKMRFDSLPKTFNRQTRCISTGNVIADTQLSYYIRPYTETECNGRTNPPGHLQDFDLKAFDMRLPTYIIRRVRELTRDRAAILYHFFYYSGDGRIDVGAVLTTTSDEGNKLLVTWYLGHREKRASALDEAIKYITNREDSE